MPGTEPSSHLTEAIADLERLAGMFGPENAPVLPDGKTLFLLTRMSLHHVILRLTLAREQMP